MRPVRLAALVLVGLVLGGCALPGVYAGLSPEQLREVVRDKSATVSCARGRYAAFDLTVVHANADKGVPGTAISVDENCKIQMMTTNDGKKTSTTGGQ